MTLVFFWVLSTLCIIFFIIYTYIVLWVFVTLLPTLLLNKKETDTALTTRDYIGWTIWGVGLLLESIADYQKYVFRSNPSNADKWIEHGVWSVIRHPNFLGEIMSWFGLFLTASSTFKGVAENLTVISPILVAFLLIKISGIPTLERRALRLWKDNQKFMQYMQHTYRLIPYIY